jgi:uncharacterized protein with HEPN domain
MKKQRDYSAYLNDIYDSLNKGISFINEMTYEEFKADERTQYALNRLTVRILLFQAAVANII